MILPTYPRLVPLHGGSSAGKSDLCCGRSLNVVGRPGLHQSGLTSTCFIDCPFLGPRRNGLTIHWALGPFVRSFILLVDRGISVPHKNLLQLLSNSYWHFLLRSCMMHACKYEGRWCILQVMHNAYGCMLFAKFLTVYFLEVSDKLVLQDSLHRSRTCSMSFLGRSWLPFYEIIQPITFSSTR
jgi:hypothetical protein